MPTYQRCARCSRRQLLNVGSSYRYAMNSGTVTQDVVAIKPGNSRRSSLVESETLDMLEKQVHRLNLQRPLSSRPLSSPRMNNNDSFLRNFSAGHTQVRTLEHVRQDSPTQCLVSSFEAMRKRRCSAPDTFEKRLGLPPLSGHGKTTGRSTVSAVRPKTTMVISGKKSPNEEHILSMKPKNGYERLRTVPSMSSLSTHSAPSMGERMRLPTRPRSGDSGMDRTLSVFERLSAPSIKRPQTSYNNNESKTDLNFLNRRVPSPFPSKFPHTAPRRQSLPHETLKVKSAKSASTISPAKSHTSNENGGNSNSEASLPKSSGADRYIEHGNTRDAETNQADDVDDDSDIDEETSARIVQWLIGVENSSKIIPENAIAEDEETTETAIRIIYPGD